jgi:hypothetical protein
MTRDLQQRLGGQHSCLNAPDQGSSMQEVLEQKCARKLMRKELRNAASFVPVRH